MIFKKRTDSLRASLVHKTVFLVDELRNAKINAPESNFVGVHNVSIYRNNHSSIFQHPPSRIEFQEILLGKNPKLRFACGIKQKTWMKFRHAIVFEIFIKTTFGKLTGVFRKEITPSQHLLGQGWVEQELDLSRYSDKKIKMIFSTSVPEGESTEYCWSAWGDPKIEHECPPLKSRTIRPAPAHVFLITSDALRPDYLGAYGNTIMRTQNCDQLAREGILFSHARAQTASTLGSHASMLLSQSPLTHSITTEWGSIPRDMLSLPGYLHSRGYHTAIIPSELELMDPQAGLVSLFDENPPCYGNPAQDGSLTTRVAIDLIGRKNKPTFFWLQYFDTHPPVTPPEPYRSMYYSGDPTDEINRYRSEDVAKIKGTEASQEFSVAMPSLRIGPPDAFIIAKLEATALAFQGNNFSDPDLAIHLKNLGPKAYNNMSRDQFALWLKDQVSQLKEGSASESLLDWLNQIVPMLQEINDDITIWLDNVVDFRYPISQYNSAVSYFDSHLGKLFSYLKENGLYEKSLIIVSSPHGEILDEHGIFFHHHTLTESCLRIPMIIKPPKNGPTFRAGTKINGIFDTVDLFPTVTDLLGLQPPEGIAGTSRASHIYDGSSIPEHNSFAINNSHTMASITNKHYKFIKVSKNHMNSTEWRWRQGDKILFDLREKPADTTNLLNELPELAGKMEQNLDLWLKNTD
jgi:arylsulfatase A-like enzyme